MADLTLVPSHEELFTELGNLAGAIYNNRVFVYFREHDGVKSRITVANGRIVEHTQEYVSNGKLERSEHFLGEWAWGLGLVRCSNFRLIRSQSLGSWYNDVRVK